MKILIISGFLGAGKTTFIKEMVKRCKGEFAILENEYSSLDIDSAKLTDNSDKSKINIWEMTEGCICCSTKGDFATSVLTIANALDPEYLVVEPSGVGMLGNVIDNIKQIEYERIGLLAPITIVDGYNFSSRFDEFKDLYINQIKFAKTIVVSKMENTDLSEKSDIETFLKGINDKADILVQHYKDMPDCWWQQLFLKDYDGNIIQSVKKSEDFFENGDSAEDFETLSIENMGMLSPEKLIIILEMMLRGDFGDIVRAKGFLQAGGQNLQFDLAGTKYSVLFLENEVSSKSVFIGKNILRQRIRKYFFENSEYVKIRSYSK